MGSAGGTGVCVCLPVHDRSWVSTPYRPARCWKPRKLLAGVLRCPWFQPMMQQECLQHPELTAPCREEAVGWGSWYLCPPVTGAVIWVLWGPASSGSGWLKGRLGLGLGLG